MKFNTIAVACLMAGAVTLNAAVKPAATINHIASSLIIPVAGNLRGGNGTHFRTDLTITNHENVERNVPIQFYAGTEFHYGDAVAETEISIPARTTVTYKDVTAELLHSPGMLGAILINGSTFHNFPRQLDATYRIWTPDPENNGAMSQSSAAIDMTTLPPGDRARVIIGVRQGSGYRCNVGIYSNAYLDRSFRVTASSGSSSVTFTVTALGYSLTQVPLPAEANFGYLSVTIEPIDVLPGEIWAAYGSSVDNESGDSWLQNAVAQ